MCVCARVHVCALATRVALCVCVCARACVCACVRVSKPRSGMQNLIVALFLVFYGTSILFTVVAILIYIPTSSAEGSFFSTPSPESLRRLFGDGYSDWFELMIHFSFALHFYN